jgi:hypothetical protein
MEDNNLSACCLATAGALNDIRTRLYAMIKAGHWPVGAFSDISKVLVEGLYVAKALTRLGSDMQGTD